MHAGGPSELHALGGLGRTQTHKRLRSEPLWPCIQSRVTPAQFTAHPPPPRPTPLKSKQPRTTPSPRNLWGALFCVERPAFPGWGLHFPAGLVRKSKSTSGAFGLNRRRVGTFRPGLGPGEGVAGRGVARRVRAWPGWGGGVCVSPSAAWPVSRDMRGVASAGPREPRALLGRGALRTKLRAAGGPAAAGTAAPRGRPARRRPRPGDGRVSPSRRAAVTSGPAHRGEWPDAARSAPGVKGRPGPRVLPRGWAPSASQGNAAELGGDADVSRVTLV